MAASPATFKKFIRCLSTTTGKWAGKPFDMHGFQEDIIDRVFRREWDAEERRWKRTVREAVIGLGRKNGKTELIAAGPGAVDGALFSATTSVFFRTFIDADLARQHLTEKQLAKITKTCSSFAVRVTARKA